MEEIQLPGITTLDEWHAEIDKLRIKEKELTRAHDTVNALRRRLPMVKIDKHYEFDGAEGNVTLIDLFCGHRQLIVYHFMFDPDWEVGCPGCSWVTDAMSHPAHLHARDTSLVLISRAPLQKLLAFREQMGWDFPWYSSFRSDFNFDFGATDDKGEHHVTSVFLRDGDDIHRTYFTDRRGVEYLGSHWTYLDLTPFGRQESWEDSPEGWPKSDDFATRRHNEYAD